MFRDVDIRINNKLEFWYFKKKLCTGKTAITFAYEVGIKIFLYKKVSTRKVTPDFNHLWSFRQFLESSNSKGNIDFSHFYIFNFQFFIYIGLNF
jgi:hypothetical protein